jgi:RimJ/RimL family protein N-acetyltransferase
MKGILKNGDIMLTEPRPALLAWFCARTGRRVNEDWSRSSVIARVSGLLPVAVLVYNHYDKPDIWVHVAAESGRVWCTPDFLRHIFEYPFVQLDCGRVTALVARSSIRLRKLVLHLGFVEEGILREALPTGDALIAYGMLRRECRWIGESNVEARHAQAA